MLWGIQSKTLEGTLEFFENILWSLLGSSIVTCFVAFITYRTEIVNEKRKVIVIILKMKDIIEKIDNQNKIIDDMSSEIFFDCHDKLNELLSDYFAAEKGVKLALGKSLVKAKRMNDCLEVSGDFIKINKIIYNVGKLLNNSVNERNNTDIQEKMEDIWKQSREIETEINKILDKEYGTNFRI